MWHISIHNKKPTDRNHGILAVVFNCDSEDMGTWRRTMGNKGISINELCRREMMDYEKEREQEISRLHWLTYNSWESLINDEYRVTDGSREWVSELLKASGIKSTYEEIEIGVMNEDKKPQVKQKSFFDENTDI